MLIFLQFSPICSNLHQFALIFSNFLQFAPIFPNFRAVISCKTISSNLHPCILIIYLAAQKTSTLLSMVFHKSPHPCTMRFFYYYPTNKYLLLAVTSRTVNNTGWPMTERWHMKSEGANWWKEVTFFERIFALIL